MILDEIVLATRMRLVAEMEQTNITKYQDEVEQILKEEDTSCLYPFEEALRAPGVSLICEVKKASPSKGLIAKEFEYKKIAAQYEDAGASAISVLTEPDFFQGKLSYLKEIHEIVKIPLLRKDFIVSPYQIYQAKANGASCVLLICSILSQERLTEYIKLCDSIHLSALVEIHDEEEAKRAIQAGARIVGVNNRNLKDFTVDIQNSLRLRHLIPEEILFVAESGITTSSDLLQLYEAKVNGALIGETMMRCEDKADMVRYLLHEIRL